jgi:hypothetical protein
MTGFWEIESIRLGVQKPRKDQEKSQAPGMTKGTVALSFGFVTTDDEQQVTPLRYTPVGMTLLLPMISPVDKGVGRVRS